MQIVEISIVNFRNLRKVELQPFERINILLGRNGQGKSNLLEAIFLLSAGRSFRALRDQELINWEEQFCSVRTRTTSLDTSLTLEAIIARSGTSRADKSFRINGTRIHKLADFLGKLPLVHFSREDLEIISGAPRLRRRFLDLTLCRLFPLYLDALQRYQKVILERNSWLRMGMEKHDRHLEETWKEQMLKYGILIMQKRNQMLHALGPLFSSFYNTLGEAEKAEVVYQSSFPVLSWEEKPLAEAFMLALEKNRALEIERGVSLCGPHRDDLFFILDGRYLRVFGSQGQWKCAALALRLAEGKLIEDHIAANPPMLLDDCFSEIDEHRQIALWNLLPSSGQIFISTTFLPEWMSLPGKERIYRIEEGKVTPYVSAPE